MAVGLSNISALLLAGLRMTPAERDAAKREADAVFAEKAAAERARYNSLTEQERREYDDLTYGMMPRLAGAQEYWRRRDGGSTTGGRYD